MSSRADVRIAEAERETRQWSHACRGAITRADLNEEHARRLQYVVDALGELVVRQLNAGNIPHDHPLVIMAYAAQTAANEQADRIAEFTAQGIVELETEGGFGFTTRGDA